MDWAEEKYDVSVVYMHFQTNQMPRLSPKLKRINKTIMDIRILIFLFCLAPETPDRTGQDGC